LLHDELDRFAYQAEINFVSAQISAARFIMEGLPR